ncbi:MAG: 30S ribosomal protein S4 [Nitrososphaerota archaeon]|nr:30S ribosomal protein S4 [Candidatus Nezhaarchaeota archaeon]MDW8050438.1 30S ribosomal protein S4 [Nitrososphaerota archaeon]
MGDPKKPRKTWKGPRHPWKRDVLRKEMELIGVYGLRNKRELWRAMSILRKFRHQARRLLAQKDEKQTRELLAKLNRLGLLPSDATLDDVLSLKVEDILERRLQTIVSRKGLAKSMHHARQLIVHRKVAIGGAIVTTPNRLLTVDEERLVHLVEQPVTVEESGGRK